MLGRVMEELVGSGWSQQCGRALHAVQHNLLSVSVAQLFVWLMMAAHWRALYYWRHCHRRTD